MKRWGCLVFLVWLGVPVLALANPVTMNDFAYGLKIRVPAGVAVAAISVPEPVYKTVYRVDLGDIRVFNAVANQCRICFATPRASRHRRPGDSCLIFRFLMMGMDPPLTMAYMFVPDPTEPSCASSPRRSKYNPRHPRGPF